MSRKKIAQSKADAAARVSIEDLYAEKRFIDLWSVVHFLWGVIVPSVLLLFALPVWLVAVLSETMFVGWEFFEKWKGITEYFSNRVTDIIIDSVGMVIVLVMFSATTARLAGPALWLMALSATLFTIAGFLAHHRRVLIRK